MNQRNEMNRTSAFALLLGVDLLVLVLLAVWYLDSSQNGGVSFGGMTGGYGMMGTGNTPYSCQDYMQHYLNSTSVP